MGGEYGQDAGFFGLNACICLVFAQMIWAFWADRNDKALVFNDLQIKQGYCFALLI